MADPEYTRRTAVTRLRVEPEDRELLHNAITEWKRGCQLAANRAWNVCHTRSDVQQLAYDDIRAETALGSQHAILATHQAAEAIKESATKPKFNSPIITYDTRTMTLFDSDTVSLTTTEERVHCELVFPSDEDDFPYEYVRDDTWEVAKSTLHYRDGEFYLHLGFRKPMPETEPPGNDGSVLGVSLGVENIAVTSTAEFFPGGELAHRCNELLETLDALEVVGTRSASRTIRSTVTRTDRYVRDTLHDVSNGIVAEATTYGCDVIAFGELDDVLEELPDTEAFHERLFEMLYEFVRYKALEEGITVVQVNPEYTNQRCTDCGFTHPQNRNLDQNQFTCLKCGHEQHDDYNAAKNVAFRCIRRGPLSSSGIGAGYCALQSGRVTPDGEFTPHPDDRAEATPESNTE